MDGIYAAAAQPRPFRRAVLEHRPAGEAAVLCHPDLPHALQQAASAMARLDQALDAHPLLPAFLHRVRLEAVRRQAAVDGHVIDPWHLAAVLEGLRIRLDGALRIIDRGAVLEAGRTALGYYGWLAEPDFDQEGDVQEAERHLMAEGKPATLVVAALQFHSWLDAGGTRPPIRVALIRHWRRNKLLRVPAPITGTRALSSDAPEALPEWVCAFLYALAAEAQDQHELLRSLERTWFAARDKVTGRRSTSRAPLAIDVLAAAPLLSATTLARAVGVSIRAATTMLDEFVGEEIAVEVTHRSARRLFGLAGMVPVRDATTGPRRPEPGRGRGRPRLTPEVRVVEEVAAPPRPIARFQRRPIDYAALEAAMAECDRMVRDTRQALNRLAMPNESITDQS